MDEAVIHHPEASLPDSDDNDDIDPTWSLAPASPPRSAAAHSAMVAPSRPTSPLGRPSKRIKLNDGLSDLSEPHSVGPSAPLRDLGAVNASVVITYDQNPSESVPAVSKSPEVSPARPNARVSPTKLETERLNGPMTASQDLRWLESVDMDFFDVQPSSDPIRAPSLPPAIRSPPPRPTKHSSKATHQTTSTDIVTTSRPSAHEQSADDSGVFIIDADKVDLEMDPDLARSEGDDIPVVNENEILLSLGDEEFSIPPVKSDEFDDLDDEMWHAFTTANFDSLDASHHSRTKGKDRSEAQDDVEGQNNSNEPDVDPFDVGMPADEGWDPTKTGVFQLASKKTVQLSAEALRKAAALFESVSDDPDLSLADNKDADVQVAGGPRQSTPNGAHRILDARLPSAVFSTPESRERVSVSTVRDSASALRRSPTTLRAVEEAFSAEDMASAIRDFDRIPSSPQRPRPVPSVPIVGGFKTAAGSTMPAPSEAALDRARGALLSSPEDASRVHKSSIFGKALSSTTIDARQHASVTNDVFSAAPMESESASLFTSKVSGGAKSPAEVTPRANVDTLHYPQLVKQTQSTLAPSPVPQPPLGRTNKSPQPPPSVPPSSYTAFRSPMLSRAAVASSSTSASLVATPVKYQLNSHRSQQLSPGTSKPVPAPVRRLNLGMTPRARLPPGSPGSVARPMQQRFQTPFKNGKRPEGLTPMGFKGPRATDATAKKKLMNDQVCDSPEHSTSKAKGRGRPPPHWTPIFDLETIGERRSLQQFNLTPLRHFYETLLQQGIAEDILAMDATSAKNYIFPDGRGPAHAYQALVRLLGDSKHCFVGQNWVDNHWALIVWKLACYVRNKPDLMNSWWSWDWVVDQIKYRYEREINRAERSCVKRIQEQDSPANLPMILCVSAVRWEESSDETQEPGGRPMIITGLELTDGWYRIRSNVDKTLQSACQRGKIVVGSKLSIVGARLDSSREGTDVLEALSMSSLVISGNSTALAPWYSALGFARRSPIATLASLTSDGGAAALLHLEVDRAFPFGYVDMSKNSSHGTWNEEEERVRAEEWKRGRSEAQAKMLDKLDKAGNEWDMILDILRDAASVAGPIPTGSPELSSELEEPDEILDRLENASDKTAVIRKLDARQLQGALALASDRAIEARQQAAADFERELASRYPARDVRGFRVVRVRDARTEKQSASEARTALLTVWDADSLGKDYFQSGRRYMVTNLVPKGSWRRQTREITLATRRDSRWTRIDPS